jgi:hypothetical protein
MVNGDAPTCMGDGEVSDECDQDDAPLEYRQHRAEKGGATLSTPSSSPEAPSGNEQTDGLITGDGGESPLPGLRQNRLLPSQQ